MLPEHRYLSDKLATLFEQHFVRQCGGITFEIRKSIGGSVATFEKEKKK